ncbi:putative membrane protein [Corynebacterium variabile DSM 44702]|uniref:Putative membrane protein n=1 Tax=Corynebacterium variabile (strain DSM 44702 / CIP 107183 / JCM 12073 / NCIMB 30131) TaxID=858619 RepID=G0HFQ4_CORVD|nr:putative membrane protein [Corynebacterium variabile DSM 44702]
MTGDVRTVATRTGGPIGPVLVLATLVSSIISSFGAPLIPTVADRFHTSLSAAQWSLTVALLVGTVGSPVLGRLGDGPRRRVTLLAGLAVVTAGGVVAAVAGTLGVLLIGRALQGIGLGLAPLAMAIARVSMPQEKVAPTVALLSVSSSAGLGAGYPVSGLIAQAWGLSGAYWFGAAVSAVALVCVAVVIPRTAPDREQEASGHLDWTGAVLLAVALVAVLTAVTEGVDWGWGSPAVIVLFIVGLVAAAVWVVQQLRSRMPLVELRLLRHPVVLSGDACALALGAAMYMVLSAVTEFVQTPSSAGFGFSASPVVAGCVLIPLSVLMFFSSRALPRLTEALGMRGVLAVGCLVGAVGCGVFALWHGSLWQAFIMSGLLGIGLGTTFAAIPGAIAQAVPVKETGSAIGFYQVVRFTGYSTGSAVSAAVLAARAGADAVPTLGGYITVFWAAAGCCVLAALLAWLLRSGKARPVG